MNKFYLINDLVSFIANCLSIYTILNALIKKIDYQKLIKNEFPFIPYFG